MDNKGGYHARSSPLPHLHHATPGLKRPGVGFADHNFDRELWSRPISERCRNIPHQLVHSSHAAESPSSNLRVETTACVALGVSQGHACPAYWMMRICTSSPVLAHHGRELAPPHDQPLLPACMEVDSQKSTRKRSRGRRLDYGYAPVRLQLCRGT